MIEEERKSAPIRQPGQPVPAGDNQPPSPVATLVAEQREALAPHAERLAYIRERAAAKLVTDRETAGDAGDIIKIGRDFLDILEKEAIARRKPYRDAADAAKAVVDEFVSPLDDDLRALKVRIDQWDAGEDARIEAQRREQEAFFAKAAQPAEPDFERRGELPLAEAPPPPPPVLPAKRRRITGDLGARVDQVDVKTYRVVDVRAVPDIILNSQTVHAAIIQVARSMSKHMPTIDGIEIGSDTTNRIR